MNVFRNEGDESTAEACRGVRDSDAEDVDAERLEAIGLDPQLVC